MPAYNAEKFIEESIRSILNQTFSDFELIVVDDGSVDATMKIATSISDPRLRYFRLDKNSGTATAFNLGYSQGSGEYVANMDADDMAFPDRLARQCEFMNEHKHIAVLGSALEYIGNLKAFGPAPLHDAYIKAQLLPGRENVYNPTVMFRRSFLDARGLVCDPELKSAFDWGFFAEIMRRGGNFANLENRLVKYRVHPQQQSQHVDGMRLQLARVRCRIIDLYYPQFSPMEQALLEPLLQPTVPPAIPVRMLKAGLELLEKALTYNKQSPAGEDRERLNAIVSERGKLWRDALNQLDDPKSGPGAALQSP
ncbi:MAG: glycosyltransferase family 2 protein [Rhizobiaceae bacterium]|nr:glycosyltransferase family 2 protein [Rhizobiaceae bacterium]